MTNFNFVPLAKKMAPKSILDTLRHCILNKRPHGDVNQSLGPGGSGDSKFSSASEFSVPKVQYSKIAPEVQPSKKQKGKKIAKEVIRVDIEDNPSLVERPKDNILAKTFSFPEFMDKTLVTPTVLDQIEGDHDGLVDRFQWIGCMLLKAATIVRCSEPVVFPASKLQGK